MKFTIQREILLETLNNVSKGLSTKTPMPILTGIYLNADYDKLTFITTNKEISIQIIVESSNGITIDEPGNCVVPGKYFVEIIRKIEGNTVDFSVFDETTIKIITERSQFTLNALDKNLFPSYNFEGSGDPIVFKSKELKKIINQTSFAASTSESRIVLNGVYFEITGDQLAITATDSFRLARKETTLNSNYDKRKINIPSKSIEELNKLLSDNEEEVKLYAGTNKALFLYQNISFMTRLIEGVYPDSSSLIPKNHILEIKFNKNELISAVERASLFNTIDNLSLVKMVLKPNKKVNIYSSSTEIGNAEEDIYPLYISEVRQFQTAFSAKHLLEALKCFDSNEITFYFPGEIKPFIFRGEKDAGSTQLILPVRAFN